MGWFKRKSENSPTGDPSTEYDFDALIAAAANAGANAQAPAWKAIFSLNKWHFVGDRERPNAAVIRLRDGAPMVLAFTDEDHAQRFADKERLLDDQGRAYHFTMTIGQTEGYFQQLHNRGVRFILINAEPSGLGAELSQFVQQLHVALHHKIAETFDRLMRESRAAGGGEAYANIWGAALKLTHWYFAPAIGNEEQLHLENVNNEPAVFAFTDEVNAARFARKEARLKEDGSTPLIAEPLGAAMDRLILLHESRRVARVVFNVESDHFVALLKDIPLLKQRWIQDNPQVISAGAKVSAAETDFDRLADALQAQNTRDNMDRLWRAVYALPRWHFVARGNMEDNTIRPFVGVVDDKPFVMAFTDDRRAHAFAVQNGLSGDGGAFATLSMQTDAAVKHVGQLSNQGVFGILFNNGPRGFFSPLANVAPMLQYFRSAAT